MPSNRRKPQRASAARADLSPARGEEASFAGLTAIIFVTGGTILAMELLASRIMTPYFGVSLYIWSGILSITLVALAIGYWFGGWLGRRALGQGRGSETLVYLYLMMPAVAALSLGAAAMVYPWLFVDLARFDLVLGSFVACVVLLFVPLVATSAMNPLLVAIRNVERVEKGHIGDAGSGTVFFVSTVGSVVGVPVAAFALIPYFTNFRSVLGIGAVLAVITLIAAASKGRPVAKRGTLAALGIGGLVLCTALLVFADGFLGKSGGQAAGSVAWRLESEYPSAFGNIKVLQIDWPGSRGYERMYFQDGLIQNRTDPQGRSLSLFTYALEGLALTYAPEARSAMMLGLGAGIVPMRLHDRGVGVEIVEINPASWRAAEEHFGFEPARFRNHVADARVVVRECRDRHDVILVDLFQGDGTPEHLLTREFFRDLRLCVKEGGVVAFNTFGAEDNSDGFRHVLASLKAEFETVLVFARPAPPSESAQRFLLASDRDVSPDRTVSVPGLPTVLRAGFRETFRNGASVDAEMLEGGRVVTEAANFLPAARARGELAYRRDVVFAFPPQWLVN